MKKKTYGLQEHTVTCVLHTHIVLSAHASSVGTAGFFQVLNACNILIPCSIYAINSKVGR